MERGWRAISSAFCDWGDALDGGRHGILWAQMDKLLETARKKKIINQATATLGLDFNPITDSGPGFLESNNSSNLNIAPAQRPQEIGAISSLDHSSLTTELHVAQEQQSLGGILQTESQTPYQQTDYNQYWPWTMEGSIASDFDMASIAGSFNWEEWSNLVGAAQMDLDADPILQDTRAQDCAGTEDWL